MCLQSVRISMKIVPFTDCRNTGTPSALLYSYSYVSLSLSLRCAQPTWGSDPSQGPAAPAAAACREERRGKRLQPVRAALHWTVLTGHTSGQHLRTQWVICVCVSVTGKARRNEGSSSFIQRSPWSMMPLSNALNCPAVLVELVCGRPRKMVILMIVQVCGGGQPATSMTSFPKTDESCSG